MQRRILGRGDRGRRGQQVATTAQRVLGGVEHLGGGGLVAPAEQSAPEQQADARGVHCVAQLMDPFGAGAGTPCGDFRIMLVHELPAPAALGGCGIGWNRS
jgi:hypothetical protein